MTQSLVDGAAVMFLLPEDLGLETMRTMGVTYANERKETRSRSGDDHDRRPLDDDGVYRWSDRL